MSEVSDTSASKCYESSSNNLSGLIINEGGSDLLAVIAVAHNSALNDDVFNVIRAIVPPPPPVQMCLSVGDSSNSGTNYTGNQNDSSERLYSRRSSEACLLTRIRSQTLSSKEARINLEELFFQIIEPKKYKNKDIILHTVLELMETWSKEEAIQELALSSFLCLSQQCDTFQLSQEAVFSIVNAMQLYHRNETVQRIGVKVLKDKRVLQQVKNKGEVACVVLNSLCELDHVNDFIVYAKDIVELLCPVEKQQLRKSKPFVQMLLNFPFRKDVTIYLSWCALDIMVLLADFPERWDILWSSDGESRIQRLSQRPEFEDRCMKLLERASLYHNDNQRKKSISPLDGRLSESLKLTEGPEICSNRSTECKINRMVGNELHKNLDANPELKNGHILLSVDEMVTRQPLTPPPTLADSGECNGNLFSDDDCLNDSQELPLRDNLDDGVPSPSYSPPPEPSAHLEEELRELFSPTPSIGTSVYSAPNEKEASQMKDCPTSMVVNPHSSNAEGMQPSRSLLNSKPLAVYPCFICRESKVRQSLLMKQFSQISHVLHQPCHKLLLKCLQSNVCMDHKM